MADHDDKTVKQLLDAATRAELERWFGLPSFEQLADEGKQPATPPEDPEFAEIRKRRETAIAAVDPGLLESLRRRSEVPPDLLQFKAAIDIHVDPSIARFDLGMVERQTAHVEPREVEIPSELEDDLKDVTPQALLRDLHRPELTFDKVFEMFDPLAEERVYVAKLVDEAMATPHRVTTVLAPFREGRALLLELRAARSQPWAEILPPKRGGS